MGKSGVFLVTTIIILLTVLVRPVWAQTATVPPAFFQMNPEIFLPLPTVSPTAPPDSEVTTPTPTTPPKPTPTPVPTAAPTTTATTQPTTAPTLTPTVKPTLKPVAPLVTFSPSPSLSATPSVTPEPSVLGTTDEVPQENKNNTGLIASAGLVLLVLLKRVTRSFRRRRLGPKIPTTIASGCLLALPAISDLYELYCNTKDIRDSFGQESES